MISKTLEDIEKDIKYLKKIANEEYFKKVEEQCEFVNKRNNDLQNKIDKIKENNQRIIDYGFDYDGFNNIEDLKKLIDMLVDYARKNNDILEGKNEK